MSTQGSVRQGGGGWESERWADPALWAGRMLGLGWVRAGDAGPLVAGKGREAQKERSPHALRDRLLASRGQVTKVRRFEAISLSWFAIADHSTERTG